MNIKNEHVLLSVLLAHPLHPFSRGERIAILVTSLVLAAALAILFRSYFVFSDIIATSIVCFVIQVPYDTLLRFFATCGVVQTWKKNLKAKAFLETSGR